MGHSSSHHPYFIGRKTHSQRGKMTCSKSHSGRSYLSSIICFPAHDAPERQAEPMDHRERARTHCKGEGSNNQSSPYPKMLSISESPQHPRGLSLPTFADFVNLRYVSRFFLDPRYISTLLDRTQPALSLRCPRCRHQLNHRMRTCRKWLSQLWILNTHD